MAIALISVRATADVALRDEIVAMAVKFSSVAIFSKVTANALRLVYGGCRLLVIHIDCAESGSR